MSLVHVLRRRVRHCDYYTAPTFEVARAPRPFRPKFHVQEALEGLLAEKQPSRRLSSPEEIARLACWLCAPEAHNITGTAIPIDGGWTAQ